MYSLSKPALHCAIAQHADELSELLCAGRPAPSAQEVFTLRGERRVAAVQASLPPVPANLLEFDCRNNRLCASALAQLAPQVATLIERHGAHRVAVVMGTSTSGIAASEAAVSDQARTGEYPEGYHAVQGLLGGLSDFVAAYLGCTGPSYTISTACSSAANAFLSGRRLLRSDLCDAVVVGGVDSLCEMTLQGFGALEALSASHSRPFSSSRDGINLGEAAALFIMSKEPGEISLLGGAASSDAHHISAPHPDGCGAFTAMAAALDDAGLLPGDIDYLNLHGTGTPQNDAMESKAVHRLFGADVACNSSKALTGHTLGASGALELALCWLLLDRESNWHLPPTLYLQERDEALEPIDLAHVSFQEGQRPHYCLSNSFAFGGSNVSLVLGRHDD